MPPLEPLKFNRRPGRLLDHLRYWPCFGHKGRAKYKKCSVQWEMNVQR